MNSLTRLFILSILTYQTSSFAQSNGQFECKDCSGTNILGTYKSEGYSIYGGSYQTNATITLSANETQGYNFTLDFPCSSKARSSEYIIYHNSEIQLLQLGGGQCTILPNFTVKVKKHYLDFVDGHYIYEIILDTGVQSPSFSNGIITLKKVN